MADKEGLRMMSMAHNAMGYGQSLAPNGDDVDLALQRILASPEFRASPRLSAFLSFCVQRSAEGRADTLKAYTIATQVFMRPDHFDPQADPIVRVEATRLRRAMQRYYSQEGMQDPLHLIMERGQYGVTFVTPPAREQSDGAAIPQLSVSLLERLAVLVEGRSGREDAKGEAGPPPLVTAQPVLALVTPGSPSTADPQFEQRSEPSKGQSGLSWASLPVEAKRVLLGLLAFALLLVVAWHSGLGPVLNSSAENTLAAKPGLTAKAFQPAKLSVVVEAPSSEMTVWADDVRDALAHFDSIIVLDTSVKGEKRAGTPDFQLAIRKTSRQSLMVRLVMVGNSEIIWSKDVALAPLQEDPDHGLARWLTELAAWDGLINRKHWNTPQIDASGGGALSCQHQAMQALLARQRDLVHRAQSCFDKDLASGQVWNKPGWRLRLDLMALNLGDTSVNMAEMLGEAQRLIRQSPLAPCTYALAAEVLQAMGRTAEARDMLAKAQLLNPYDLGYLNP